MFRIGVCLGLLCTSIALLPSPAAAGGSRSGKISEARERMSESSSDDDDDGDDDDDDGSLLDDDDDCVDCESDEGGNEAIGKMLFYTLGVPFWLPQMIAGDREPMRAYDLQAYPYADGAEGPFRFRPVDANGDPIVPGPLQLSLRMLASYERNGENMDGRRFRLTLRTNARLGLDAGVTRYTEALGGGEVDALWHYQALATVAFAVSPRSQFTFALGGRRIHFLAGDSYNHLAMHYGAEFFPVKPLHAWVLGEASFGPSTWTTEVEGALGVLLQRYEVFAGYRHVRIMGVDFAGPEVGVVAWF